MSGTPELEGEARLKQAFKHVGEAFVALDAAGRVITWSSGAHEIFGWTHHAAAGRSLAELIVPPDLREAHSRTIARVMAGGTSRLAGKRTALPATHRDGRPLKVELAVWRDCEDPGQLHMFFRDVTEQAAALEALSLSEKRFRALFESGPIGEIEADPAGSILSVNPALVALLGRSAEQLIGQPASTLLHADDSGSQRDQLRRLADGEIASFSSRRTYGHADGSPVEVLVLASAVRRATGEVDRLVGMVIDVTDDERARRELIAAHRALSAREEFQDALLDSVDVGIVACGQEGHLTHFNATSRSWHGLDPDARIDPADFPRHFSLFDVDGVTPLAANRVPLLRALQEGQVHGVEMVVAPHGGRTTRVVVHGRAFHEPDGALLGAVVAMHDITEQRALEDDLRRQALYDHLTGLPNRVLLSDRIDNALAQRVTGPGRAPALLLLDLDSFKSVNDTHGHEQGDLLLIAIAGALLEACRAGDTVARLGGDEFAVLLPDTDLAQALRIAERITRSCAIPRSLGDLTLATSASIGLVLADGQDRSTLLRQADIAMYAAKAKGGGTTAVFDVQLHSELLARHQREVELRSAAAHGELVLEYQPVMHLARNEMVGVEALVRWEHPVDGRIPPLQFIPLAEESGSIKQIGAWVLEQACRQVLAWDAEHPLSPPLDVAVNLSPRQLLDDGLVDMVRTTLENLAIDPTRVTLEVTESALGGDTEMMIGKLDQLKALGVRLAIDDFGTGYSSLSFLRRLPVDILKIDKSFVDGIAREPEEWALTTAIVKLATSLGKQTLAEGVELGEQLAHLRALRCELAQGYLFDRPLSAAMISERIAAAASRGADAGRS